MTQAATHYLGVPETISGFYKQQLATAYANLDLRRWGIFSPWADESPMMNFGMDYRKDQLGYEPDEVAQSGDLAGNPTVFLPIHGSIQTKELFGEARIPLVNDRLVRRLALEGGFRRSWYTSGTNKFSTDTYKLALDLTAVEGLRFRASQQRAVRAPNLQELFTAPQADFFDRIRARRGSHPTEEECARTGVSPAQYGHILNVGGALFGYNAVDGGNPDLLPETATTRTAGVVLEPRFLRGYNATIDWWAIDLKGAIAVIGPQTIVDTCIATGDSLFCSQIHRSANGSLWLENGFVDNRNANIGGFQLREIDIEANYSHSIGAVGSIAANFRGSYVNKWIVDFGGLSEQFDCAGLYGDPCGNPQPRWRHTARLTWNSSGGARLSVNWRHIGGMKLAALDPKFGLTEFVSPLDMRLKPQSYFDLTGGFDFGTRLAIRVGVNNIFDREPPPITFQHAGGERAPQRQHLSPVV